MRVALTSFVIVCVHGQYGSCDLDRMLDGQMAVALNGVSSFDRSGFAVSSALDFNGDDYDDVLIGASNASGTAGAAYLIFGNASRLGTAGSFELSSLDGVSGVQFVGCDAGDDCGRAVSWVGDVNGDSFADVLIGAPGGDPSGRSNAGKSFLVFGSDTPLGSALDLSTLDGTNGIVFNGVDAGDRSGWAVSGAGDVDNDGFADFLIGAYLSDGSTRTLSGETYLIYGSPTLGSLGGSFELSTLAVGSGEKGVVITGVHAGQGVGDASGFAIGSADIDGDTFSDVLISAPWGDAGGRDSGESYVVFGGQNVSDPTSGSPGIFQLSSLIQGDGSKGVILNGVDQGDASGIAVAGVGDVNGDGFQDVLIGAWQAASGAGESYLIYGNPSIRDIAVYDIESIAVVLNGVRVNDTSGVSVSSAGDVNGDNYTDILIGSNRADSNDGEVYLIYGAATPLANPFELADLAAGDGSLGVVFNAADRGDNLGFNVASAGDVDGDGYGDLLLGAVLGDPGGINAAGETYLVYGPILCPPPPTAIPTASPAMPSSEPSGTPTFHPSVAPTLPPSSGPSERPTFAPTYLPTLRPTPSPTYSPTSVPAPSPTGAPTLDPRAQPTLSPTLIPSTLSPVPNPSLAPTPIPSQHPSPNPSQHPTPSPSRHPTPSPSQHPTPSPSRHPTPIPTTDPTGTPTLQPTTRGPTSQPTVEPAPKPTSQSPISQPTPEPTIEPTAAPSPAPVPNPTALPSTRSPTAQPTMLRPSHQPTLWPTTTTSPTSAPAAAPTPIGSSVPLTAVRVGSAIALDELNSELHNNDDEAKQNFRDQIASILAVFDVTPDAVASDVVASDDLGSNATDVSFEVELLTRGSGEQALDDFTSASQSVWHNICRRCSIVGSCQWRVRRPCERRQRCEYVLDRQYSFQFRQIRGSAIGINDCYHFAADAGVPPSRATAVRECHIRLHRNDRRRDLR